MRKHPSAMSYAQRFFTELPHPLITRRRLREILEPQPGETLLEIGPGTGYYTLSLAEWVGPAGVVEILDLRKEFLDHVMRRVRQRGLGNIHPTTGDAQSLPYDDGCFDAAVLIAVLGEIPDQAAALRELRRVIKPGGRLVVGELFPPDPHMVLFGSLKPRVECAGFRFEQRLGPGFGYFARFST
jgi:ubiquinone/menaquinone biosynthesis C-methylase UbiE